MDYDKFWTRFSFYESLILRASYLVVMVSATVGVMAFVAWAVGKGF